MPTEMGSPIYRGHRPPADASCVALLRRAGAVILGKTVTCEFAGMAPRSDHQSAQCRAHAGRLVERFGGGGRRPHGAGCARHADRRLGAAAVVPIAAFSASSRPTTPSTRCRRLARGGKHRHHRPACPLARRHRAPDRGAAHAGAAAAAHVGGAPRIGLCRTEIWDTAQPETKAAVEGAAAALGKAGATVREITLPQAFKGMHGVARGTVNFCRARRLHGSRLGSSSRGAVAADAALRRERPENPARGIYRRLAARSTNAARCCPRCSKRSTCCWCRACRARRRRVSK